MEVKGVLPALDSMTKNANTKLWPADRRIAAFLRALCQRNRRAD
jgi:hypothetical protein